MFNCWYVSVKVCTLIDKQQQQKDRPKEGDKKDERNHCWSVQLDS